MASPKGHAPYPGCEKGADFGYLGKPDDAYNEEDAKRFGDGLVEYVQRPDKVWFKGYFAYEGLSGSTVDNLKNRFPYFSNCIRKAKAIQESKLVDMPFFKVADANIAKFVLINNHEGWAERSEQKISGDPLNPLSGVLSIIDGNSKDLINGSEIQSE